MKSIIIPVWIGYIAIMFYLPALYIGMIRSQPPDHCRYMVPVKNVPGVYGCSQYPRPINATKSDLEKIKKGK